MVKLHNQFAFCYLEKMLKGRPSMISAVGSFRNGFLGLSRNGPMRQRWVDFVIGSLLAPTGFSPDFPVVPLQKNQCSQIPIPIPWAHV